MARLYLGGRGDRGGSRFGMRQRPGHHLHDSCCPTSSRPWASAEPLLSTTCLAQGATDHREMMPLTNFCNRLVTPSTQQTLDSQASGFRLFARRGSFPAESRSSHWTRSPSTTPGRRNRRLSPGWSPVDAWLQLSPTSPPPWAARGQQARADLFDPRAPGEGASGTYCHLSRGRGRDPDPRTTRQRRTVHATRGTFHR